MIETKLSKAAAMAIAGVALSAGAVSTASAAGITMYNTFTTASGGDLGHNSATDGWTRVYDSNGDGTATGPESQGNKGTVVPWVGTAGGALPFGYTGSSSLNWAAELQSCGLLQISRADAQAKYGTAAEIDTGAGAWQDNSAKPTGWKHQTDIGIIKSDFDGMVTLHLSRLDNPSAPGLTNDNFGVTIFTGMDTNTGNYSHHGSWNCPTCTTPKPYDASNPFGTAGLTYLTHSGTVNGTTNGLTFSVKAGQYYTVYLGGAGVGSWSQNVSDYALDISAVPEPASLSLFAIASAAMAAAARRRKTGRAA